MRDTKTFIVFEVTLTTAAKNLLLCIFLAQIKEHVYYQLRVLISVYVHFLFFISNCGLVRIIIEICFILSVIIFKKIRVFAYLKKHFYHSDFFRAGNPKKEKKKKEK